MKEWKFDLPNCKRRRVLALEETKVSLATRETKASKVLLVLGVPRECRALWATGALQAIWVLRGLLGQLD